MWTNQRVPFVCFITNPKPTLLTPFRHLCGRYVRPHSTAHSRLTLLPTCAEISSDSRCDYDVPPNYHLASCRKAYNHLKTVCQSESPQQNPTRTCASDSATSEENISRTNNGASTSINLNRAHQRAHLLRKPAGKNRAELLSYLAR